MSSVNGKHVIVTAPKKPMLVYVGDLLGTKGKDIVLAVKYLDSEGKPVYYSAGELLRDKSLVNTVNQYQAGLQYTVEGETPVLKSTSKNLIGLGPYPYAMGALKVQNSMERYGQVITQLKPKLDALSLSEDELVRMAEQTHLTGMQLKERKLLMEFDVTNTPNKSQVPMFSKYNSGIVDNTPKIAQSNIEDTVMHEPGDKVMFRLSSARNVTNILSETNLVYPNFTKFIPFFRGVKGMDSVRWEDHLSRFGKESLTATDVIGSVENNGMGIQENEKEFYDYLCKLIRDGVAVKRQGMSTEEIDKLLEDGIVDPDVTNYLKNIAELILYYTRNYSGYVQVPRVLTTLEDSEDDDDNSSSSSSSVESVDTGISIDSHYTLDDKGHEIRINYTEDQYRRFVGRSAFTRVEYYVSKAGNNPYVWAEVIIKLLRWGNRKPTVLDIEGIYKNESAKVPLYLNLTTFKETTFAGDWDKEVRIVKDGCDRSISQRILVTGTVEDQVYLTANGYGQEGLKFSSVHLISGLTVESEYESGLKQSVSMDLFTFMDYVKNQQDGAKVQGVRYDAETDKFIVDEIAEQHYKKDFVDANQVRSKVKSNSDGSAIFEISKDLMALAMKFSKFNANNFDVFKVWETFMSEKDLSAMVEAGSFTDAESFARGLSEGKFNNFNNAMIAKAVADFGDQLLYVQREYNKQLGDEEYPTLQQILDVFNEAEKEIQKASKGKSSSVSAPNVGVDKSVFSTGIADIDMGGANKVMEDKPTLETAIAIVYKRKDELTNNVAVDTEKLMGYLVPGGGGVFRMYGIEEVGNVTVKQLLPLEQFNSVLRTYKDNRETFNNKFKMYSKDSFVSVYTKYREFAGLNK